MNNENSNELKQEHIIYIEDGLKQLGFNLICQIIRTWENEQFTMSSQHMNYMMVKRVFMCHLLPCGKKGGATP